MKKMPIPVTVVMSAIASPAGRAGDMNASGKNADECEILREIVDGSDGA